MKKESLKVKHLQKIPLINLMHPCLKIINTNLLIKKQRNIDAKTFEQ